MKVDSLYRKLIREKARTKFKVSGQLPDTCQHGSHQAYVYYACRLKIRDYFRAYRAKEVAA